MYMPEDIFRWVITLSAVFAMIAVVGVLFLAVATYRIAKTIRATIGAIAVRTEPIIRIQLIEK
jgi:hypothetical protein